MHIKVHIGIISRRRPLCELERVRMGTGVHLHTRLINAQQPNKHLRVLLMRVRDRWLRTEVDNEGASGDLPLVHGVEELLDVMLGKEGGRTSCHLGDRRFDVGVVAMMRGKNDGHCVNFCFEYDQLCERAWVCWTRQS